MGEITLPARSAGRVISPDVLWDDFLSAREYIYFKALMRHGESPGFRR